MNNKYKGIYMPEHHRASHNGMVYEHILIVESILERPVKDEEHVHHLDEDKTNNSAENLIVFRSNGDHSRFHKTGILQKESDGTYTAPIQNKCTSCGKNIFWKNDSMLCRDCWEVRYRESTYKVKEIPTKEKLLELITSKTSFCEMGRIYGISDNGIRKWCRKFGLI